MEPLFRNKITEVDGRIWCLYWLRKNTTKYSIGVFHSKTVPSFEKCSCSISNVLNSFPMFWAQVVSRMQEFYVSTIRFCALIQEILWKIYAAEFSYQTYHGWRCIDFCDCKWLNQFLSHISHFISRSRGKILPWIMP